MMPNVFDQYTQPENRLTHALVCSLAEDTRLLRRFVRWATSRPGPKGTLRIVEQQRPGEAAGDEEAAVGLPDAWIYNDDGWGLLIESKVAARLGMDQIRRHFRTAARRDFKVIHLLVLTAREERLREQTNITKKTWNDVYGWLTREARRSGWAARCKAYMEILESDLIEQEYLKEGSLTTFSGITFNDDNPYNYFEAKRLLQHAMGELRKKRRLARELGINLKAPGRGAITGKVGSSVWDFLRVRKSGPSEAFTKYPHFTFAIERSRLLAILIVPHGIRPEFRRRIVELGREKFLDLLEETARRIARALRGDEGAAPQVIMVQRRYITQRSRAIADATLEFDLRTAYKLPAKRGKPAVKLQPQWIHAAYDALASKRSNLQLAIGAAFPYARSTSVGRREILDRVSDTWIACKPLLTAMGAR